MARDLFFYEIIFWLLLKIILHRSLTERLIHFKRAINKNKTFHFFLSDFDIKFWLGTIHVCKKSWNKNKFLFSPYYLLVVILDGLDLIVISASHYQVAQKMDIVQNPWNAIAMRVGQDLFAITLFAPKVAILPQVTFTLKLSKKRSFYQKIIS